MKLNFIVATDQEDLSHIILNTIYTDHVPQVGSWVKLFGTDVKITLPQDWIDAAPEFDPDVWIGPSAVVDHIEYDYSNLMLSVDSSTEVPVNVFVDVVEVENRDS